MDEGRAQTVQIPLTPFLPRQVPLAQFPLPRAWWRFADVRVEMHPGLEGWLHPGEEAKREPFAVVRVSGEVTIYELPEELLGEVLKLDPSDPDAHVDFTRDFGLLTDPMHAFLPTQLDFRGWRRARGGYPGSPPPDLEEATLDFWFAVGHLKAMFALYTVLRQERFSRRSLASLWPQDWRSPMPITRVEAEEELLTRLGFALDSISVELAEDEGGHLGPAVRFNGSLDRRVQMEIVNAYLADRPYRQCANEPCGKWFSIQDSEPPKGVHKVRDALRFHHPSCRTAQHQREYRRRKKGAGR